MFPGNNHQCQQIHKKRHSCLHSTTLEVVALPKSSNLTLIKPQNLVTDLQKYKEQRNMSDDTLASSPWGYRRLKTPQH